MAEICRLGLIPILDLLQFGLPDWIGDFQNPELPLQFARWHSLPDPLLSLRSAAPLARLRARGELVDLRVRDLRFTVEEASCFLNERMGLDLAPEVVRRLTERTEGWITGL